MGSQDKTAELFLPVCFCLLCLHCLPTWLLKQHLFTNCKFSEITSEGNKSFPPWKQVFQCGPPAPHKRKPVAARQQDDFQFSENRTILFSSKNTNKNVILLDCTGCTYTVIWYPDAAHGGSTCHKALLNSRDVGSLSIPLQRHHQNMQQGTEPNTENAPKKAKKHNIQISQYPNSTKSKSGLQRKHLLKVQLICWASGFKFSSWKLIIFWAQRCIKPSKMCPWNNFCIKLVFWWVRDKIIS